MTVWTNVALDEANEWLAERELGRATMIVPIEDGVEDSVFRLNLEDGSPLFLRLFERTEPQGPLEIAARLADHGLPTCSPIQDQKKRLLVTLNGKPAAAYPWIDGAWIAEPSMAQIEAIGRFLGQMGYIGVEHCNDWARDNPRGWAWFDLTAGELAAILEHDEREELETEVSAHLSYWRYSSMAGLPHGPIHADLFRNNVMWDKKGDLAAVIDWGFCASGYPLIFDLAIVANDWCLQKNSFELDLNKLAALMNGRCSVYPLSEDEQRAWPMALRWAALRFYLSRLYDYHLPREGKKHDPFHFQNILRTRQKL